MLFSSIKYSGSLAASSSYANDSNFWVVPNFGQMIYEQGYLTQTTVTLVRGVAAMIAIFAISLFVYIKDAVLENSTALLR